MVLIIILLCLLPLGLLLYKRRWRQSIVTAAVPFLLFGLSILMVWIFGTNLAQNNPNGGAFGDAIDMSRGIFNDFIVPSLLFICLTLLVLSIFKGLQERFLLLKHPLFINALLGITILVWVILNLTARSTGPFGGDTPLETIPTAVPISSNYSSPYSLVTRGPCSESSTL